MKKRIVALLLGGVLAVGSLAVPMTAQAVTMSECSFESLPHIRNLVITGGDGQLTLTVDMDFENTSSSSVIFYLLEKELVKEKVSEYSTIMRYWPDEEYMAEGGNSNQAYKFPLNEGGTWTSTGLKSGQTYYVYVEVNDWHDYEEDEATHFPSYIGSVTASNGSVLTWPSATPAPTPDPVPTPTPAPDPVPAPDPTPAPVPTAITTDADAVKAVAADVLKGKWGVGRERKARLEAAGYDYAAVQKAVARLMK